MLSGALLTVPAQSSIWRLRLELLLKAQTPSVAPLQPHGPFHPRGLRGVPQKGVLRSVSLPPPLALSDTDSGDDSVFVEVTPRNPHQFRRADLEQGTWGSRPPASSQKDRRVPRKDSHDSSLNREDRGFRKGNQAQGSARSWQRVMRETSGSESSDEEIASLAMRVKQAMLFSPGKSALCPPSAPEEKGPRPSPRNLHPAVKKEHTQPSGPNPSMSAQAPKSKVLADVTQLHQTQPTRGSSCQIPGCFLRELSDPESQQSRHFCNQKEELAQKLYAFYNSSVFEQKLPGRMEILWNKKMRKTAGCCVTGQLKEPEGQRYARIMLSEKVCDSADRLRDTLIHELCHAATWLIHGVRDGHGRFWNLYAKKAAVVHPELPMVARCHNYEIKYKFTYECVRCQNTIGRHSKSLDTQRFVCALCQGQLVLCKPMRKDGMPAERPLTPFAKYVKEYYGSAKRSQPGLSHGAIMKKLSVDFASQEHVLSP
ncbi:hypothetical protein JD844_029159 [Phrynosoma platyrhinos]|uniref:SprT-like domain-containing protein n=1 Tax=Phrynosoma platyrhinos TaxID=52577 RepID=A0ABQ7SIT0_PHRPL|nr:hypothetical protein JD844_029159 [Phrynosoma platyrhinos]